MTLSQIQGDLQAQIMPVLWRLNAATVEQVRSGLPKRYRSAYTTIQTVLNRLADRGLATRSKSGNVIVYRPAMSEAEYLSGSIERTLAEASSTVRQAVLAQLIGTLDPSMIDSLQQLAEKIADERRHT